MVLGKQSVATVLLLLRARHEFDRAFAHVWFRSIARRSLRPLVDLLRQRGFACLIGRGRDFDLRRLCGDGGCGAANVLRLKEISEI